MSLQIRSYEITRFLAVSKCFFWLRHSVLFINKCDTCRLLIVQSRGDQLRGVYLSMVCWHQITFTSTYINTFFSSHFGENLYKFGENCVANKKHSDRFCLHMSRLYFPSDFYYLIIHFEEKCKFRGSILIFVALCIKPVFDSDQSFTRAEQCDE